MAALLVLLGACAGVRGDLSEGLVLNEVLAKNLATNADEMGEFDDWVEVFNGGEKAVSRDGLFLSDNPDAPTRWPFPEGPAIAPGEFLLVWCDGEPEQGDTHAIFKLAGKGESVSLSYARDEVVLLDEVEYGEQAPDVAWARVPDGDLQWRATAPTPGASNGQ